MSHDAVHICTRCSALWASRPSGATQRSSSCLFEPNKLECGTAVFGVLQQFHGGDVPEGFQNGNDKVPQHKPLDMRSRQGDVEAPYAEDDTPILRVADSQIVREATAPWNLLSQLAAVVHTNGTNRLEHRGIQDLPEPCYKHPHQEHGHACQ